MQDSLETVSGRRCLCPLCGNSTFTTGRFDLEVCASCGLKVNPRLFVPDAAANAETEWFSSAPDTSGFVRLFERLQNERTWSRVAPFVREGERLVEVGVGSGSFLAFARQHGLVVTGCDLSPEIAAAANSRFGVTVRVQDISDVAAFEKFDVAVLNHVVEHVEDPIQFLGSVRRALRRGGVAHIAAPNVDSIDARLPGWVSYEPYHLLYFTPETLRIAAQKAGFSIISVTTHESFSGWTLSLIQTFVRFFWPRRVNTGSPSTHPMPALRRSSSAALRRTYQFLLMILGAVTLPARWIQERIGRGDEIIILARNECE
jgi:2-polyprenyl-3-methyl-5-hydroxy-6-metoxy-1,4-benzoquinol methylase